MTGDPGDGGILWNNEAQLDATDIHFSGVSQAGQSIYNALNSLAPGQVFVIEDTTDRDSYQVWGLQGYTDPHDGYVVYEMNLLWAAGQAGDTGFPVGTQVQVSLIPVTLGDGAPVRVSTTPDVTYWAITTPVVIPGADSGEIILDTWGVDTDMPAYFNQGTGIDFVDGKFVCVTAGLYMIDSNVFLTPETVDIEADSGVRWTYYCDLNGGLTGPGYNYQTVRSKELRSAGENPLGFTAEYHAVIPLNVGAEIEPKIGYWNSLDDAALQTAYISFTRLGGLL